MRNEEILIKNGDVIGGGKSVRKDIFIRDGRIEGVDFKGGVGRDCQVVNARDCYVSPGFIDMHCHGGGGFDLMDGTREALKEISYAHLKNGTTTMMPTTVSARFEDILRVLRAYRDYASECPNFYGVHLEGPYLSACQKGAHKKQYLHPPNEYETGMLLEAGSGIVKRITAAPELENMPAFAKAMVENGITLSVGHSDASSDAVREAVGWGFSHITHLYSATPSIRKINERIVAGVVEAAYLENDLTVEMIGDGKHTAVDALKLAVKIKGIEKVALVTDSLRPAGIDVKESWLGEKAPENRIIIEDDVAKLPDRSSFAGSIATTGMMLRKGVEHYGFSVEDTVRMLTETPASILKLPDKGKIEKGYAADIVIFDRSLHIQKVFIHGMLVK